MKIKIPPRAINGKYKSPDCDFGPTRKELWKILKSYNLSTDGWKKDYHVRLLGANQEVGVSPYHTLLVSTEDDIGKVLKFCSEPIWLSFLHSQNSYHASERYYKKIVFQTTEYLAP